MVRNKTIAFVFIAILLFSSLMACGGSSSNAESVSSEKLNQLRKSFDEGSLIIDYDSAEDYEAALNDGEDTKNKVVQFRIKEVATASIVGFNLMAGEHLNFKSENTIDVSDGDYVTVLVTETDTRIGSWFIDYELIGIGATPALALSSAMNNTSKIDTRSTKSMPTSDNDQTSKAEIEQKSIEEATRQAQEEAARQAQEEAARQAQEEAARQAQEEAARQAQEEAARQAQEAAAAVADPNIVDPTNTAPVSGGGGNGDNFDTYNNPEQQNTSASYVLNTSTMKFHFPSCNDVKKISPENYSTSSSSRDDLISMGYSSCGHCKP